MEAVVNRIRRSDCIQGMNSLPAASVDLVFADPPFNIGYKYDVYDDSLAYEQYIGWSRDWMSAVHRVLKDSGTFWLAIGDEFAAELKLECQKIGFHTRSWVIWYYTFGVNCSKKFTRSHAHLFYFVKDPRSFTFLGDDLDNRIPSARQLVYNDNRANPRGRLPDDTWIIRPADHVGELVAGESLPLSADPPRDDDQTWTLRPQDLTESFSPAEDTWYVPRVAGTFKERAGFHGCQMPEQLLGRIIRLCSNPGDLVLDPFSGSATTVAVAKKLARRYLAFDLSPEYVKHGTERLKAIRVGDRLDGSAEPLMSAPPTVQGKAKIRAVGVRKGRNASDHTPISEAERRYQQVQRELTESGVVEAFSATHDGHSADRVVADPDLNREFLIRCQELGIVGDARTWNTLLFRLRKAGKLTHLLTVERTTFSWPDCDPYIFGSEIALQTMLDEEMAESLDEILCDPNLAEQFDLRARRFAPGFTPLQYRWAALKLRKQASFARSRGCILAAPSRLGKSIPVGDLTLGKIIDAPGVYLLREEGLKPLYVGEAFNLRTRLTTQFNDERQNSEWRRHSCRLKVQFFPVDIQHPAVHAWQSCLAKKYKTTLNLRELSAPR